jgi:hypothetical protein
MWHVVQRQYAIGDVATNDYEVESLVDTLEYRI